MPEWWDDLTNSVSGLFKQPEPKPAVDMSRFAPVLEQAGYGKDSAERKLLEAIAGHVNSAPIPKEATLGQKAIGGGLHAIGAGLARGAGASVEGAMQPAQRAFEDWNNRDLAAGQGRMSAWKYGGEQIIPTVSGAVTLASNRKLAKEMADRQNARIFGSPGKAEGEAPIYEPAQAAPAAPGGPGMSPALMGPAKVQPGFTPNPPAPQPGVAPQAAAPSAAPQGRQPSGDEPTIPLAPGSPIRFYTQQYRDMAVPIMQAIIDENAAGIASGKGGDPKSAIEKEANTPGSALQKLINDDRAAYHSSLPYEARKKGQEKNIDRSFETFKEYEASAAAARKGNTDLAQFSNALFNHIQEGGSTGPMQDWAATLKSWANGIPGVEFDISRVEEMRKASIGAATKFMRSATVGPTSDREMKTFLDTVTNASMSTQGNLRLLPFLKLQNDAQLEIRQLAGQMMEANNGVLPWNFSDQAEAIQQKYQAQAKKLGDELVADYKAGKLGPPGAAKPSDGTQAPVMSKEEATKAARALIQQDPTLSAAEAMKRVLGGAKQPSATGGGGVPGAPEPAPVPAGPPETGWNPGKPGTIGGAVKGIGDWFTKPRPVDDVRKLVPQAPRPQETPRSQIWMP